MSPAAIPDGREPPLAAVEDLSVEFHTRFGTVQAVKGVSWSLQAGQTLAIVGESGSGKSVSAAAIMGLIDIPPGRITAGRILYRGLDLLTATPEIRRGINGRKIAMIFQDPLASLNPVYSVGWQIAEVFRIHGVAAGEAETRAVRLLERVGIPDARRRAREYPHQFSGGQRQRVMIAMAIALEPDLLIADEPTTALDVTIQAQILELLRELRDERQMGLVLITHDLGVVAETADHVAVMQAGQIVETGTVGEVLRQPQHPYTRKLLEAVPGRGPALPGARDGRPPLLEVENLDKSYPRLSGILHRPTGELTKALEDVTFTLHRGETIGIVGESGSGKSTLARVLLGLAKADGGTAAFEGRNILDLSEAEMIKLRRRIQVVFQDPSSSLNPRMSIEAIVSEPWHIHPNVVAPKDHAGRVRELLLQVGLEAEHARRYPHQLSGGQKQRVAIARALALEPDLIICDEAVSALDVSVQAQVIALLSRLREEKGLSYLFIAHDLGVVRDFAHYVVVMQRGQIVEQGPTAEIYENPRHPYTRELLAAIPVIDAGPSEASGAPPRQRGVGVS